MVLFLKGLLIGLSIAATVGPMSLLCIQRTLERGRVAGLFSGLGIATADATYGAIAGFGLTFISRFLVSQQLWIRLLGGLFLLYLGVTTIFTQPAEHAVALKTDNLPGMYLSTLLLTLTNPLTILSFVAIFAGVGLSISSRSYNAALILVLGVFLGSAFWWVMLTSVVSVVRTRLNARLLRWLNILSGAIISLFGIFALISLLAIAL